MLSEYICTYHPAAPGSSPKHTFYAFINLDWFVTWGKDENQQKEAGIGLFFKKNIETIESGK